ncbi:MAG: hypothetical protein HPY66_0363 [Firmicutes bacterium]|nr:hypothetical protein [Bacillota bacterium]
MSTKKNWKELFYKNYSENGYSQEEIEELYIYDMELQAYFDFSEIMPRCLKLQNKIRDEGECREIRYYWKSHSQEAECPFCGMVSRQPCNDYFTKPIQDIPRDNLTVYHEVTFKKYFCENPDCKYKRFVERFPQFSEEDARKTIRLKKYCIERALGCGCNHAEKELKAEGAVVSHDMIMEYLKAEGARQVEENLKKDDVRVLAIDDINLRKGDKSSGCTVFIDAETHKTLIIIRGTTKEAVKKVMEKFQSVEFLSRDRASSYSSAGEECGKTQVADRFHLIKNAHEAIKETLMAEMPAQIFIRDGDGWVQETQGEGAVQNVRFHVPEQIVEDKIKLAGLSEHKAKIYRNTLKMLELSDKGLRSADIAHELGLSLDDVRKLRRSAASTLENVRNRIAERLEYINSNGEISEKVPGSRAFKTVAGPGVKPARESIVEPYRQTVIEMWKAGGNHRTIHPVITAQGYTGSANAIYQYLLKLAKEESENVISRTVKKHSPKSWEEEFDSELAQSLPDLSLEKVSRDTVYRNILREASKTRPESDSDETVKAKPNPKTYENSRS